MNNKNSRLIKIWGIKFLIAVCFCLLPNLAYAQGVSGKVLILYDSSGQYGWLGNVYAKMLANLVGHFQLDYQLQTVESYNSNDVNVARATFYIGSVYDNSLPASFKSNVVNTTNTVCWIKYNIWKLDWDSTYSTTFESRYGFQFWGQDSTGYSNVVYKGTILSKDQTSPAVGYTAIINSNIATNYAKICKNGTNTCIPYILKGSNFWYVADNPFSYMGDEDRYLAFADALHDILGIAHSDQHLAFIRLHSDFDTNALHQFADYLHSNNVPFGVTVTPNYKDPLGVYNSGVPEDWHLTNSVMSSYVDAIKYMATNGGQVVVLGYTHQYNSTNNPSTAATWDDYEFWREKVQGNTNFSVIELFQPLNEDSNSWVQSRLTAATNELGAVGLGAGAWMTPFYYASALDYRNIGTNFPVVTGQFLYYADDYSPTNSHYGGQFFPYTIYKDYYGQRVLPENIGNILPPEYFSPGATASNLIRLAQYNLVVRDGWASGYMSVYYNITNLQALVSGIQAAGYTYVPVSLPWFLSQPQSQTVAINSNATFQVTGYSILPAGYQWYYNSSAISGATNALLTLTSPQNYNVGNYYVVMTNSIGSQTSAVVALTVIGDSDADGLDDTWEISNFGSLAASPDADPDGDGWTNLQEYQNGTNPNSVDQPLRISILRPSTGSQLP